VSLLSAYDIAECLHDGEASAVHRARRRSDGQPVIIKVSKGHSASARQLTRFRNEYDLLSPLDLDGVVRTYGLVKHGGQLALILEDFGGMPLKSWLARGRVSLEEGLRLAARLASIVGDVHAAQIIHKDINPHNIVYNPQTGVAKLIDFDIATQLRSEGARFSAAAGLEGTLAYIAPEQTGRMNRALDYRADLYSLGITIYELLTGVLPHDSGDPLEIVHFHIAGALTPPHVCDPQVPRVVSDIVAKLLAKAPEDRYQSAIGAAHDLAACHEQLRTSGRIDTFPIAAHDAVDRFEPPQKLYGRSTNVDALLASFERVAKGCVEAVLVSGHAGVGKTALVQEIYEPVTRRRGYFAAGKFDQLRRDIPFSGLVNALQDLVQQLLTEDEGALADWRRAIQAAVAPNGRLLLDVLPALELIIGPQPSVPPLDAVAAQNRFNLVFKSFMKLFCTKQNADDPHAPLVLFLDDMQWADPASLNLVTMLLSATTTESLLLIGACRDEETNATHPLTLALQEQRERGVRIETVSLAPLAIGEVAQLVADATREEPEGARPLAETILRKTGGNPFFVRQFLQTLHTEKLIAWDGAARRFRYSIADIEAASITENVAELLARKLDRLPGFTRLALSLAAAIGNDFELNALAIVCERSAVDVAAALEHAVRDGLIAPTSKLASLDPERLDAPLVYHRYVFLHDRIQQAAYATIPAEGRAGLHLAIGRILLLGTADADLDARIFDIVHHLNHGIAVIDEPGERLRLATLNLRAGTRAKNSTAYALGVQAFRVGIELLGAGAWSGRYETAYELHSKLAECLCLTGDYPAALAVLDDAAAHARAGSDLSKLHAQKVIVCVIRGDMRAALECAGQAAEAVGIRLSGGAAGVREQLDAEIAAILRRTAETDIERFLELPPMTDTDLVAALTTVVQCMPAAAQLDRILYQLICCRVVTLSLEHGNCAVSAKAYGNFALILGLLGRYEDAWRFGKLGVDLNARLDDASMRSSVYFCFAALASAWSRPVAESIELFRQGIRHGLQSGDHAHVGYNAARCITHLQFAGQPLAELAAQMQEYEQLLHRVGARLNLDVLRPRMQLVRCLRGESGDPLTLNDADFDDARHRAAITARGGRLLLADYLGVCLMHRCIFGDYRAALAIAEELAAHQSFGAGYLTSAEHNFYHSLAMTGTCAAAAPAERAQHDAAIAKNQERMRAWMDACPGNFAPLWLLIEAERARLAGSQLDALDLYDRAIAAARHAGFVHVEAIACERAMSWWEQEGRADFAGFYLERALQAWDLWGAQAKLAQLARTHVGRGTRAGRTTKTARSTTGTTSSAQSLDVAAVVKASQAISGEIVLERLLATLMDIIVEAAGAEHGSLILESDGRMLVQASKAPGPQSPQVMQALPLGNAERLSPGIVNYVIRTREHVVIDDAAQRSRFRNDPYVQGQRPKSVLCAPVVHKGALTGALYLENNLVTGAFTPDRLEALNILLSQIAVSIENATLYARQEHQARTIAESNVVLKREIADRRRAEEELGRYRDHLEELVVERTRELEEAQGRLVDLSRKAGMAEVAAGVLHNVGNVMNSVNVGASMARESVASLQIDAVLKVSELLLERAGGGDLGEFLTRDERGRRVPEYLDKLGHALAERRGRILGNIDYMLEHLEHMKRIVSAQQTYAKSGGMTESCAPAELVEAALAISAAGLREARIEVRREIESLPSVLIDRHRVLQILVNLVSNAKHALMDREGDEPRVLRIAVRADGGRDLVIEIEDNGVGIDADVLTKIFNHGFTTRREGHGFGLHNSANAAQAMDGRLTAHSRGRGHGARFVLQIPLQAGEEERQLRHA